MHVECHGLRFDLPDKWVDVTDDLPPGTAAILARPTGVGAAKFSISRYQGGEDPAATIEDLSSILAEYCGKNSLECDDIAERVGEALIVQAETGSNEEFRSLWLLSNGRDFAFMTYVCQVAGEREQDAETQDAARFARSIEFR